MVQSEVSALAGAERGLLGRGGEGMVESAGLAKGRGRQLWGVVVAESLQGLR